MRREFRGRPDLAVCFGHHGSNALRREEIERGEDRPGVGYLAVLVDQPMDDTHDGDALEADAAVRCARQLRPVGECVARIERGPVKDRVVEGPAEIPGRPVEPIVNESGNGRSSCKGAMETVVIDAVRRKQGGKTGALVPLHRVAEAPEEKLRRKFGDRRRNGGGGALLGGGRVRERDHGICTDFVSRKPSSGPFSRPSPDDRNRRTAPRD